MSGTDVYRVSANFYRILESDWPCGPLIGFYCFFSLSLGKLIGFSSVALELKIAAAASPSRQRKKMFSDVPAVHNQARHVIFSFVFRPRRTGFFYRVYPGSDEVLPSFTLILGLGKGLWAMGVDPSSIFDFLSFLSLGFLSWLCYFLRIFTAFYTSLPGFRGLG